MDNITRINNIVFFNPSRIVGGSEYYFMRYAEQLARYNRFKVFYIDYPDGFAAITLKKTNVNFIEYSDDCKAVAPHRSIVMMQLNLIRHYEDHVIIDKTDSGVMFFLLHSLNLRKCVKRKDLYVVSPWTRKNMGQIVRKLSDIGIIKYLDYGGVIEAVKDFMVKPKQYPYLPLIIPTSIFGNPQFEKKLSTDVVKFCWLGRLDKEKSKNIQTYMNELDVLSKQRKLSLYLIGDGAERDSLYKLAEEQHSYPIYFIGEKRDAELDSFIRSTVDIGLASGTSSLEFAIRMVPVIEDWVLDRVYKSGERSCYNYLCERDNIDYSYIKKLKYKHEDTFMNMALGILNNYSEESRLSFEYAMSKSPENASKLMLDAIDNYPITKLNEIYPIIDKMSSYCKKGWNRVEFVKKCVSKLLKYN